MFIDIVNEIEIERMKKTLMVGMAKVYEDNLPDSLYYNHYQLAEKFGFSPSNWNEFLKIRDVDMVIQSEIAQIAEIGARRALLKLESGKANSADISAAKELLSNSKLLQQKSNQRPTVIITRVPGKENVND